MNEDVRSDVRTPLRGMILAAGYGTRLAPVTDHVPKPLLPVDGQPLLDQVVDNLERAGVREIGVNTHHLGSLVEDHVDGRRDRDRFTLFPEKEILGTGGALDGARDFLAAADHFLLHNGDVLCDADLKTLVGEHDRTDALATLLLVDWPLVNSVTMAVEGRLLSLAGRPIPEEGIPARRLTYSGIGIFSTCLLNDIGPGFSSLIDPLVRAISQDPESVRGHAPEGVQWSDLGTLFRYLQAQNDLPPVKTAGGAMSLERITGHGSPRRFWRLAAADWSAVAMVSPPEDEEFRRFTDVAGFLQENNLGAPALLTTDPDNRTLLMEDLGPGSLYSLVRQLGWNDRRVEEAYRLTVDHLLKLQTFTAAAATACPCAVDRCLDEEGLRWETDYFRDRFLAGHLGLVASDLEELDSEFQSLAKTVAAQRRVLIHRDFQSQNIHPMDGRIGLVDFQGMRLGPLTYDLMSLLLDPYVAMPVAFRTELLDRFASALAAADPLEGPSAVDIRAMALGSGLQRIMQALGAFGFLGHVQGKRSFLEHIPAGLAALREILGELNGVGAPAGEAANIWRPSSMPVLLGLLDTAP